MCRIFLVFLAFRFRFQMRTFTLCRHLSTTVTATSVITATTAPVVPPLVRKCAIISTSNDVFANLALEHWIYKHVPFSSFVKKSDNNSHNDNNQGRSQHQQSGAARHLLMLWVNEPCVVVGRHQNPWHECDVAGALRRVGAPLARRNSGGGTVYHDLGNLNLTFFTPPDHYNRRYNLEFIAAAIFRDYTLKVDINKREDLIVRERKISGTAAKVARHAAYHHCTLLVEADLDQMRRSLAGSVDWEIQTNATKSTRTKIVNLRDEQPRITVPNLTRSLAARYLQQNNINNNNDNQNVAQSVAAKDSLLSESAICCPIDFDALTVQTVDPTEENFPGLNEIIAEYRSWEWIYGRCPKFTASKVFFKHQGHRDEYVGESQSNDGVVYIKGETFSYRVNVFVENGLIIDVDLLVPEDRGIGDSDAIYTKLREVRLAFIGQRYDPIVTKQIENLFGDSDDAQLIRFNV